jgi:hypothetical protein
VVTRILVDKHIEGGRQLVEELDRQEVDISAALWFYLVEEEEWCLLLASKLVDDEGPLAAYELIQKALANLPEDTRPSFMDISVVSPSDGRIQAIGTAVKTGPGIKNIRFSRNAVNNMYIEDALIYRSN